MQELKTFFLLTNVVDYSFKYTEVLQLAKKYEKVILIDFVKTEMQLPSNVTEWTMNSDQYNGWKILARNSGLFFSVLFSDLFFRSFNWAYYKKTRKNISFLLNCMYHAEQLSARIKKEKINPQNSIFLSFWLNNWSISLGILKKQNFIPDYYARAHGFDVFEYRVPQSGRLPYRRFELQTVKKVYSVSKNGEAYLKENYPEFASKIFCNYLGTENGGESIFKPDEIFTLVSCASTRGIKRIYMIPEILKRCNFPVRWIHLGDENLNSNDPTVPIHIKNKEELKQYPLVQFEFKGHMETAEIVDFYRNNSVNIFISVSETEGLPVSIMEAISFGIPVIATDVGGCREIVTEQTGILIPRDFNVEKVANQLADFRKSKQNTSEFRNGVRSFWAQHFEVTKNYQEFFSEFEKK